MLLGITHIQVPVLIKFKVGVPVVTAMSTVNDYAEDHDNGVSASSTLRHHCVCILTTVSSKALTTRNRFCKFFDLHNKKGSKISRHCGTPNVALNSSLYIYKKKKKKNLTV